VLRAASQTGRSSDDVVSYAAGERFRMFLRGGRSRSAGGHFWNLAGMGFASRVGLRGSRPCRAGARAAEVRGRRYLILGLA
jgi:hypothetical protein